jgi:hypothetical protein
LTTIQPDEVQLRSPIVQLKPGSYRLAGRARILVGGVGIVVRDVDTGATVAESDYSWVQGDYLHNALAAEFDLKRTTRVQVRLFNWTTIDNASSWVLWRLDLQRLGSVPAVVTDHFYTPRATPLTSSLSLSGPTLRRWPFDAGTPQGWDVVGNPQQTITPTGLDIRTTLDPSAYQLGSEPFSLPAGRYAMSVSGRVLAGGVEVGVLDDETNSWLVTQHFWSGQRFGSAQRMVATVTLSKKTRVRLLLANWAPKKASSEWIVAQIDLVKLP